MKAMLIAATVLVGGAGIAGAAYAFNGNFNCTFCKGTGRNSIGTRCSFCNGTGCVHQEEITCEHGAEHVR